MKEFQYTIRDEVGIHARPAGLLVREATGLSSVITVECNGRSAEAKKLFAVMGLGVKCGETVTVRVEGKNEDEDCAAIKAFFEKTF